MGSKMNKKGQVGIIIGLLVGFLVITILIALVPGIQSVIETGENSQGLNCVGYVYNGNVNSTLSYNATIGSKSTIGCLALNLYIPYIILVVLIAVVINILYNKNTGQGGGGYSQGGY